MRKYFLVTFICFCLLFLNVKLLAQSSGGSIILAPVGISISSSSTSACAGDTVSFTSTVTGVPTPYYQWQVNSVNVSGADSATWWSDTLSNNDTVVCLRTSVTGDTIYNSSNQVIITVNTIPVAGSISGADTLCTGTSVTLGDTASGGNWSMANANATNTANVINGITAGTDTVYYVISNGCGTDSVWMALTINASPVVAALAGRDSVCTGDTLILADSATGGTWSMTNALAVITGGVVTGANVGMDTVVYVLSNSCGSDTAYFHVTIKGIPNAGTITTTADSLCIGATALVTNTVTGGTWSLSNSDASLTTDTLTAIASGMDTVTYIFSNSCGADTVYFSVTIKGIPNAGIITSTADSLCIGATALVTNTVTTGVWSLSNSHASLATDTLTGITTGLDTISYIVSNSCGADTATQTIFVNAIPAIAAITGRDTLCTIDTILFTDAATGGAWTALNNNLVVTTAGYVYGITPGIDTIVYSNTNGCGSDSAVFPVTYIGNANPGAIITADSLCTGTTALLSDSVSGGVWSLTNAHIVLSGDTLSAVTTGIDTIVYEVGNHCGLQSAMAAVKVNQGPDTIIVTGFILEDSPLLICINYPPSPFVYDSTFGGSWSVLPDSTISIDTFGHITPSYTFSTYEPFDTVYYTLPNGCFSSLSAYFVGCEGIPSVNTPSSLSIYPNPANDELNIADEEKAYNSYILSNTLGQTILTGELSGALTGIDIHSLPSGVYYLTVIAKSSPVSTVTGGSNPPQDEKKVVHKVVKM